MSKRDNRIANTKCLICGKSYFRFPYEILKGSKIYCSNKCRGQAQKHYEPNTECAICGRKFYRNPNKKKSKSGLYFCSRKCQNEAYRTHMVVSGKISHFVTLEERKLLTKEQYNSLRNKRNKQILKRTCSNCGNLINDTNKSGYCRHCCSKVRYSNVTPEQRQKWSEDAKTRMRQGKIKSWQSRNKLSYPEKFFKKVLENNKIKFEGPNFVVKQKDIGVQNCLPSSCYFLDFKIGSIDLEIDGKQHQYKEHIESDNKRDKYLTEAGYKVYRIKWRSINTKSGKEYIKSEIEKLLKFLSNMK